MRHILERPVFIVGSPRSGTTLLRFLLSNHPRIHIPDESGFVPFLLKDVEARLSLDQVNTLLDKIGRLNRFWKNMVSDTAAFYRTLPEPKLAYVLDGLYRMKISPYGAERWGDKTPGYIRYIPVLNAIFPSAQFIHLIRDGRDATVSAQKKWSRSRKYMDSYYLLKSWDQNVSLGRRDGLRLGPERYHELHYESLVREPDKTLQQICAFLQEVYYPDLADHSHLAQKIGAAGQPGVYKPVFTTSIHRWKTEMSVLDQKIADRVAGRTLVEHRYELAELNGLSAGETLQMLYRAIKFAFADSLRRILYTLGLLTLNRGMRRGQKGK